MYNFAASGIELGEKSGAVRKEHVFHGFRLLSVLRLRFHVNRRTFFSGSPPKEKNCSNTLSICAPKNMEGEKNPDLDNLSRNYQTVRDSAPFYSPH